MSVPWSCREQLRKPVGADRSGQPQRHLTVKGESAACTADEVSLEERVQIMAAYKPRFGKLIVGRYFAKLPDPADRFGLAPFVGHNRVDRCGECKL